LKIHCYNEWDKLKEIVVGSAAGANWPGDDPIFSLESESTSWHETPVPNGPVPQWIIDETNEDLNGLVEILEKASVEVHRPRENDFVISKGLYNYCPRDRLIIAGNKIIDPAMLYPCRDQEIKYLDFVVEENEILHMPRNKGMILDAANILRLGEKWLFLESKSGNRRAYDWLVQQNLGIDIELCNFYSGVHIDSTVVALREGLVLLNASRVEHENLPDSIASWDKIWIDDVVAQGFYQYPYASKWIAINMLSISPDTVIVDSQQTELIRLLETKFKFDVIPHTLRHSRTLGGGFHCVTLDLWREYE
jgi:scyllo-inosamine-4-phosphate amidinotransferase 1